MKTEFREITLKEFTDFTKKCHTKNYMQSPAMEKRYQQIGRESYLLGLFDQNNLIVAGLVSCIYNNRGLKIFSFSRGPLMDFSQNPTFFYNFLKSCATFLKAKKGSILQISPTLLAPYAPADFKAQLRDIGYKYLGEYEQVKWVYAIDFDKIDNLPAKTPTAKRSKVLAPVLTPEEEQTLLRSFRRDHRHTIKYATERYHIKLRELQPSEYDILLKLLKESGKVHGFVPRDQKFFEQMANAFGDEVATIVAELPDGTPIASAFFLLYGNEVIYLSSGLSREHKKLGGPHLIQWAMIKYAYANGYHKYNFWGTNPDPENGVYKFKQGFHGEVEEFVGTFATSLDIMGKLYLAKIKTKEQRDL
ncbi:peptidoglycan bridge formation glycyltransferase FemA/FemB family protein [Candidatus Saccharibacteria bacterium]|nr:peptidoglycan bridge formation glycyltransferase FemA/FemB family protein [Candidatus Saccharibacteria bacterium]